MSQVSPIKPRERTGESAPSPAPAPPSVAPPAAPQPAAPLAPKRGRRGASRFVLLVVLPIVALVAGGYWWLSGGRYVTTDNAYIGAEKVMITPQVSGAVSRIDVVEGRHVGVGDK